MGARASHATSARPGRASRKSATSRTSWAARYASRYSEDWDIETRIGEMDEEGVDVELLVPGSFTGHDDVSVDVGLVGALHRFLDDACSRYPDRLTSLITASARNVESAVTEIESLGRVALGRAASSWTSPSTIR